MTATVSVGLSLVLDALFEEFPDSVHPVALFGRAIGWFDSEWRYPTLVGACLAVVLPVAAAIIVGGVTALGQEYSAALGVVLAGGALFSTTSLRMLVSTARTVIEHSETAPSAARDRVIALVGRETDDLSPAEIRSAALESAAENLADGLVAPLLAFAVGTQVSLGTGVAGAVWVKAVNTLDSMLGYHSKEIGWASARLDDVVMWVPARLTVPLLAFAAGSPLSLWRARVWRDEPSSPNSGWPMATLAATLDVRLAKRGAYTLNPDAALPTVEAAHRGVRNVGAAGVAAFVLTGVAVWF
jgi:adenosylcobinamide-phosphate synthase